MLKRGVLLAALLLWSVAGQAQSATPPASEGWIALFDGQSLQGWKAGENADSFQVINGQIACNGPRSHLFYVGEVDGADFKNFELKADVMARPGANSGIYFHTQFQERDWPQQGFEVQINNTHEGAAGYHEYKKTGSLYGIRNLYKAFVKDNEWFTMHILVMGKRVQVKLNEMLVVDYLEPENPIRHPEYRGRQLSHGTFALQCHDHGSKVFFKNVLVKPLPDSLSGAPNGLSAVDDTYAQIMRLNMDNFPLVDFHVHLKGGLALSDALDLSRKNGINYGIAANCGLGFSIVNDTGIDAYLKSMEGQPVFVGMQAEGREWVSLFSRAAVARFDYVFTDAMTFTDDQGKRTRLWIKEEVDVKDKQAFMDMYVKRILGVLNNEPVDIYVNPTFLPECIAQEYDTLWTKERMQEVIGAAVKNGVAIEINARYRLPSAAFIKLAKSAGVKFSFGTNNAERDLGRLEYCLQMIKECGLTSRDMFMPKPDGKKPIQVR